jgi:hypothetical protein
MITAFSFFSFPDAILKSGRASLDTSGFPTSHFSETSSLQSQPSPTLSVPSSDPIRFATSTVLRDNKLEGHGGSSSLKLLAPPSIHHRRMGSVAAESIVGSFPTERGAEDNHSFRLNPVRYAQSDINSTLPSPAHTYVDATGSDVLSRMSSLTNLFKKTLYRVRRPSLSPTGETSTNFDTTRNDGQKRENADVKQNKAELTLLGVLDLGLGTQPIHGLSTKQGATSGHPGSSDPPSRYSGDPPAAVKGPLEPNTIITSCANLPRRMPSLAKSGGCSSVNLPALLQSSEDVYRTSIKDRHRIFGWNVISRRPSETLIQLMWLVLQDGVLVC